ncbi:hypothetical protein IEO21_10448 [Rhodonia placenta]|uniref:Uncharacterized protein n=1 Tax=Rhodonia placenta TaxID=104341 RepID=A0A8H7TXA5_9APHY|nr:hypothetical protein IEO21_10448 [Postia placenta]
MHLLLKHADPRGQERARKLGRVSSRGPEAPIVVYNNPARCTYCTRLSLTGIASPWTNAPRAVRTSCSNTIASARWGVYYLAKLWGQLEACRSLRCRIPRACRRYQCSAGCCCAADHSRHCRY